MRASAKTVLFVILLGLACVTAAGQQNPPRPDATYRDPGFRENTSVPRLLTLDEGLAVLGAALDSRHHRGFTSDCSHFVHGLYRRAGFPYTYAASTDLYSGIDQFQRVTTPQAGDLVAWRGHVGIVVNPVQHSFFSLLRSGPGVESYDSSYWKRRGHPRFFRYIKANPGASLAASLRNTSVKPKPVENAGTRERAAEDHVTSQTEEFSTANDSGTARLAGAHFASPIIPHVAVLNSDRPTPDQVRTAFLQTCADSEDSLRGHDIFRSAQPVVVFDHFIVRKLHISGTQGWAEVEMNELVSVAAGRSEARNHSERQRWPLIRRSHTTWELTPPQQTIYLPQNIAAHLTAQELAQLTKDGEDGGDGNQKTELAQLLNVLLQK